MNNGKKLVNKLSPNSLFLYGLMFLVALTVIRIPFTGGTSFFSLLHCDRRDAFMDFFNSIYDAGFENPYTEKGVIYPPLTYLFYRFCGLVLPPAEEYFNEYYGFEVARNWKYHQFGILMFIAVTGLALYFLYKTLLPSKWRNDPHSCRIAKWILLGSVPFWYAIERGNLILFTVAFLAYFVNNYNSESPLRRELALISLAVSVSLKIYPVCFGVLLLTEKRYRAALRCVLYGIILFFVPFAFVGGFSSFGVMLENIRNTGNVMATLGWGYKVNIDNTLGFLAECFRVPVSGAAVIKFLFLAMILWTIFFSRKRWQRLMALSSIMIIFPGFSFAYTLVFAAIPLIIFLTNKPKTTTRNLVFSLFFLCMFAPFPVGAYAFFEAEPARFYQLNLTTIISSIAILLMIVSIAVDTALCQFFNYKPKLQKQTQRIFGVELPCALVRFFVIVAVLGISFIALLLIWNQSYR